MISKKSLKEIIQIMDILEKNGKDHNFKNIKTFIHGEDNIRHMSKKQLKDIKEISKKFYFDEWSSGTPGKLEFLIDDNNYMQFACRIDYNIVWSYNYKIQDSDIDIEILIWSSSDYDDLRLIDFEERDYNYND